MRKDKKILFIALIIGSLLAPSIPAHATEVTSDITTEAPQTPIQEIAQDELQNTDTTETVTDDTNTIDSENETTEEKEVSYKEAILTITKSKFIADTFNGVDAIYRPRKNDGRDATYSCAAFIKKYYKTIHEVSVYNLYAGSTPRTYEGVTFKSVKTPKAGDIAYANSHWAIVKKVDQANNKVVLIEQNWKYALKGQTVCKVNRTISTNSLKFYRLNQQN